MTGVRDLHRRLGRPGHGERLAGEHALTIVGPHRPALEQRCRRGERPRLGRDPRGRDVRIVRHHRPGRRNRRAGDNPGVRLRLEHGRPRTVTIITASLPDLARHEVSPCRPTPQAGEFVLPVTLEGHQRRQRPGHRLVERPCGDLHRPGRQATSSSPAELRLRRRVAAGGLLLHRLGHRSPSAVPGGHLLPDRDDQLRPAARSPRSPPVEQSTRRSRR